MGGKKKSKINMTENTMTMMMDFYKRLPQTTTIKREILGIIVNKLKRRVGNKDTIRTMMMRIITTRNMIQVVLLIGADYFILFLILSNSR